MISFIDFAPGVTGPPAFLQAMEYERFETAVQAANAWLERNGRAIRLINIETVLLPNVWDSSEQGTGDAELATAEGQYGANHWYQIVRIWYEAVDGA